LPAFAAVERLEHLVARREDDPAVMLRQNVGRFPVEAHRFATAATLATATARAQAAALAVAQIAPAGRPVLALAVDDVLVIGIDQAMATVSITNVDPIVVALAGAARAARSAP